ncbi:MAG: FAD-dependent oxidoreductase [Thaumarchaeota archaeon]|nr:FAD-dependent oxidoreductase [Nitrososphaerota archaeon]
MQLLSRQLSVVQHQEVAPGVIEIICKQEHALNFKPGQYVNVSLDQLRYPDPKGKTRTFNLVSSPNNSEYLGFSFLKSNSGFKKTLTEIQLNTKIEIKGPFGIFTLPENSSKPVVFIADGIGITPCVSIALYAAEKKLPHKITVLYTSQKTFPYLESLQEIQKENPNFTIQAKSGPIDSSFIKKHVKNIKESKWFVSGTAKSASHIIKTISQLGVSEKDIQTEEFSGY